MKIEDRLKGYRILEEPTAREEKIMETVRASQNAFFEREQEQQKLPQVGYLHHQAELHHETE